MTQERQHRRTVEAAAAASHDRPVDVFASGRIGETDLRQPGFERLVGEHIVQLTARLQHPRLAIDDPGEAVLDRLHGGRRVHPLLDHVTQPPELVDLGGGKGSVHWLPRVHVQVAELHRPAEGA